MLYEEQAAELLRRCEALAGRPLPQVRGNLRRASTRAEAVWEMLVLEAVAQLGQVECEQPHGGPDIRLLMPSGRWLSIEVTYLHPRFEDDERRCGIVSSWLFAEESKLGPVRVAIESHFDGGHDTPAGTRLVIPEQNERKRFLNNPEVVQFLKTVQERPNERHRVKLTDYTLTLTSRPRRPESDTFFSSSRPALESPKDVREHAAFRALRNKIEQHKVDEPYVVCIGSDVSPVLRNDALGFQVRLRDALGAALRPSGRLSAVMTVPIETHAPIFGDLSRQAKATLHQVSGCRHPLTPDEVGVLGSLNLNRWKYTFPLARQEPLPQHRHPKVGGPLKTSYTRRHTVKLGIPASVLVDILAGRATLLERYGGDNAANRDIANCLQNGWAVIGCSFVEGSIEQGQGACVELEIAPPHDPVFWGAIDKPKL